MSVMLFFCAENCEKAKQMVCFVAVWFLLAVVCVCVFVLLGAWYGESEHLKSELFSEGRSALPVKSQRVMDNFVGKTNVLCTRV